MSETVGVTASPEVIEMSEALRRAKSEFPAKGWQWYPYHSLSNWGMMLKLATASRIPMDELLAAGPVLDIGCADGDLAFLLQKLGAKEIDAVDYPPTNYNAMRGIRALKQAFQSNIGIHERNLDARFDLPRERYGLVLALGLLYHLKNPYYFVETLAEYADYCFLSTRVARRFPGVSEPMDSVSAAYLLEANELNDDPTNFWIFSDAGLKRMLHRAGWDVLAYLHNSGDPDSNPTEPGHDQRAFCLLRNQRVKPWRGVILGDGWYRVEEGRFRWTAPTFTLEVSAAGTLSIEIYLTDAVLAASGKVRLTASAGNVALAPMTFRKAGIHRFRREIPGAGPVVFTIVPGLPPNEKDARALGVIVCAIEFT